MVGMQDVEIPESPRRSSASKRKRLEELRGASGVDGPQTLEEMVERALADGSIVPESEADSDVLIEEEPVEHEVGVAVAVAAPRSQRELADPDVVPALAVVAGDALQAGEVQREEAEARVERCRHHIAKWRLCVHFLAEEPLHKPLHMGRWKHVAGFTRRAPKLSASACCEWMLQGWKQKSEYCGLCVIGATMHSVSSFRQSISVCL